MSLQSALRELAASDASSTSSTTHADVELVFDDVHGLWGGDRIAVRGGELTVETVPPSGRAPAGARSLAPGDLVRLAEVLVAVEPWRPLEVAVDPRTGLPPPPKPDQSLASLTVRVGAEGAALHGPRDGRLAAACDRLVAWAKAVRGA